MVNVQSKLHGGAGMWKGSIGMMEHNHLFYVA
jgi:hypothetical protein